MTILDRIVEDKRRRIIAAKARCPLDDLRSTAERADPAGEFFAAVTAPSDHGIQLIAEIKEASPSAGVLSESFDVGALARSYGKCGAAALSVLTDEKYFRGHSSFIELAKKEVSLPVLCKDFVVDEYQVYEARTWGADALLLIAEVLGGEQVAALAAIVRDLGMTALVEVHAAASLDAVLSCAGDPGPETYILGINNRDLAVQRIVPETVTTLARKLAPGLPFISESGISKREDVVRAASAGACAVLVGESLMRSDDIVATADELLGR